MAWVFGGEELKFCREREFDDLVTDDISMNIKKATSSRRMLHDGRNWVCIIHV